MAPIASFSGPASGLDTAALIGALVERQRTLRITPLSDRIESLNDTAAALRELSGLLRTLATTADRFREVRGGGVTRAATSSDETILTATAGPGSGSGTYSLTIAELARGSTLSLQSSRGAYTSPATLINPQIPESALPEERIVVVTLGTGPTQEITELKITNETTLEQLVTDFNDTSTRGSASLLNVGSPNTPDYRLVISSRGVGIAEGKVAISVGSAITDPNSDGDSGDGAFDVATIAEAADAVFTLAGIGGSISRSTNLVSDLVPGVIFNLQGTGSATVTVTDDTAAGAARLSEFVDAWNKVKGFISAEDAVTSGQDRSGRRVNTFGPLSHTSLDESLESALRGALSRSSTSGGTATSMADLGVTTRRDGTLAFDEQVFLKAASTDPEGARRVLTNLGESLAAPGGTIDQFTRFNGLIGQTIAGTDYEAVRLNGRIADLERMLDRQEQLLTGRFSRLEGLLGRLAAQQSTLTSLLPR